MEEFREHQGWVNEQLRELITGLSRQVLRIANNPAASGEGSSGTSNSSMSRLARVEFPRFWGEDVQGWIYKCEQFFAIDNIGEEMRAKVASIHMSDKALQWQQSYMKSRAREDWPSWIEYKVTILSRFGPKPFDDPLAELMKLKQNGTVEQYQEGFDALLSRVELTMPQAISCFLVDWLMRFKMQSTCSGLKHYMMLIVLLSYKKPPYNLSLEDPSLFLTNL